jgi:hypothetical protein
MLSGSVPIFGTFPFSCMLKINSAAKCPGNVAAHIPINVYTEYSHDTLIFVYSLYDLYKTNSSLKGGSHLTVHTSVFFHCETFIKIRMCDPHCKFVTVSVSAYILPNGRIINI